MRKIRYWQLAGWLFTLAAGAGLHFLYPAWPNGFTALFGPVNESTWEHLKLIFWPMALFAVVEYAVYGKKKGNFLPIRTSAAVLALAAVIILFYTYSGVLGTHVLAADIAVFVLAAASGYLFSCRQLGRTERAAVFPGASWVALAVWLSLAVCFAVFSYYPPRIALFLDPVSGGYGV